MNFKEQMAKDNAAFTNPGEFAEEILWNGKPLCADIASGEVASSDHHGINIRTKVVTLVSGNVPAPVPDEFVQVDGESLRVKEVEDELGLLEVTFYRNEA